ncbi:hypothetical protein EV426DRAFT_575245 [Tirmania nivea]|nr:hypothetical protein EV426DRAFT_575245 [Tirmania nivea]
MADWAIGGGLEVAEGGGEWTWERERRGRLERSRINLFLSRGGKRWGEVTSAKLSSDHWTILADMDWGEGQRSLVKEAVDWKKLEDLVEEKGEEDAWWDRLEGATPYEKLKSLRKSCLKKLRITERSKRWWDEDLMVQLKLTRKSRREKPGDGLTQEARIKRWKAEKEGLRKMIREKKKDCWQKFCGEQRAEG